MDVLGYLNCKGLLAKEAIILGIKTTTIMILMGEGYLPGSLVSDVLN